MTMPKPRLDGCPLLAYHQIIDQEGSSASFGAYYRLRGGQADRLLTTEVVANNMT